MLAFALALIAVALLVAAPALGFHPVGDVFGQEPSPSWTWPEGVPGEPVPVPDILRDANEQLSGKGRYEPVDLSSVRQIVAVGSGAERQAELAARGLDGDVCLAIVNGDAQTPGSASPFGCLHARAHAREQTLVEEQAVFVHEAGGGHRGSVVDYTTITGVARADVGRVELELVNGETIELPLNRWRGFGYYATNPQRFPETISVYRTWSSFFRRHEKLVGEVPLQQVKGLAPTPLCGGSYGPCPSGVKP
jgi:hypothetical protein